MTNLCNETEIWKEVDGYESLYEVSNHGRVRRLTSWVSTHSGISKLQLKKGRILKIKVCKNGYCSIALSENAVRKHLLVHRLVAFAFIDNPFNYNVVNHKNGIRADNRCENLEWCTTSQNNLHSYRVLHRAPRKDFARNNPKVSSIVNQYSLDGTFLKQWPSISEIYRVHDSFKNISGVVTGKRKTANGFIWRLPEQETP